MGTITRYPELGDIVWRDKGRASVRLLILIDAGIVVLAAIMYWWLAREHSASAGWLQTGVLVSCGIAVALLVTLAHLFSQRALVVCRGGLVRHIRLLGPAWGSLVVIDYRLLRADSMMVADDLKALRHSSNEMMVSGLVPANLGDGFVAMTRVQSSLNEWGTGRGIAFLADGVFGSAVAARAFLDQPGSCIHLPDPRVVSVATQDDIRNDLRRLACWTHPTAGDPTELARIILSTMAQAGEPWSAERLQQPLDWVNPIWGQIQPSR
ncbi:MAG: hypothetical protein LBV30_05790 [Propionibacteriaceae bacterium]|jgi:hypothetical protein|nr:hypothetical protein [Propionibacteriaceae bacterium]